MSLGELRRILGPVTGFAVCVGTAVGAGILRSPGEEVAARLPSAPWIMGVWCMGALVATLDAFILAEMAAMVPRVGGLVAYVRLSYGPATAFLVGWSMLLVTWPASLATVAVATGELVSDQIGPRAVAVPVIVAIGAINLIGLRFGAAFEIVLVLLKIVLLAGICIAAAVMPHDASAIVTTTPEFPFPATGAELFPAMGLAMVGVIWTYDGYADAVYMAGETRDPGRALPRALLTALVAITGLFLLANATFLHVLGVQGLAHSKFPAFDIAQAAFGTAGGRILNVIGLVVMFGAINAYFLTGPRIGRLLAEEGLAVRALGRVAESGAPVFGTIWMVVVSSAFAMTQTFGQLTRITVPIISATTMLVAIGLLLQRRRAPDRPRPFRVPWAPLFVGLQVAIGLALLASFLLGNRDALAIDAGALLLGLCCYASVRRRRPEEPS